MIPIISIVGKSNSGKTTLIEKLIPEFKRRGYRIGTIKHHLHDFEVDQRGKDSWRHAQAGADAVAIASPYKLAFITTPPSDLTLDELRDRYFQNVDLVIAEGYKGSTHPKVEVFRAEVYECPLFRKGDNLLATVSDINVDTGVPCFGLEDIAPLVDLLENTFLSS
ncbi:molybdopterin-guanine dinucleotide biosynthesis protein B [Candidatus Vecturithrix granuli]|uniref:Molybdopterin-guanine dinucleotide biosynthesis protein B n=1 Tax=Vecturithrix granuli TaxID=1499967 RepID=A0A081C386_VECG1|nr:molybdopterin-guanine dinucleotide biosynthesis protein B [Candidatus Vecturithrix granuli]